MLGVGDGVKEAQDLVTAQYYWKGPFPFGTRNLLHDQWCPEHVLEVEFEGAHRLVVVGLREFLLFDKIEKILQDLLLVRRVGLLLKEGV